MSYMKQKNTNKLLESGHYKLEINFKISEAVMMSHQVSQSHFLKQNLSDSQMLPFITPNITTVFCFVHSIKFWSHFFNHNDDFSIKLLISSAQLYIDISE